MKKIKSLNIVGFVIFAAFAVFMFYYVKQGQEALKLELTQLSNTGIEKLIICPVRGSCLSGECKNIENATVIKSFSESILKSKGSSPPGHTEWNLERAFKVKTANLEKWYLAVEFKGHEGVFYVSGVEMKKDKTFTQKPRSVAMHGVKDLFYGQF